MVSDSMAINKKYIHTLFTQPNITFDSAKTRFLIYKHHIITLKDNKL